MTTESDKGRSIDEEQALPSHSSGTVSPQGEHPRPDESSVSAPDGPPIDEEIPGQPPAAVSFTADGDGESQQKPAETNDPDGLAWPPPVVSDPSFYDQDAHAEPASSSDTSSTPPISGSQPSDPAGEGPMAEAKASREQAVADTESSAESPPGPADKQNQPEPSSSSDDSKPDRTNRVPGATTPAPRPSAKGAAPAGAVKPSGNPRVRPKPPRRDKPTRYRLMPHAKAGEEYSGTLTDSSGNPVSHAASVIWNENAPTPDWLSFDTETGVFAGTPDQPGDFTFQLPMAHENRNSGEFVEVQLSVLPDPRSMWQHKESDRSQPFPKEDDQYQEQSCPPLLVVGGSKRGRSHAHTGAFRDDDFAFHYVDGWYIAAVADGAGSATYSRKGSEVAVTTMTQSLPNLLQSHLPTEKLGDWLTRWDQQDPRVVGEVNQALEEVLVVASSRAVAEIEQVARDKEVDSSSFSTTLVCTVLRRVDDFWFIGSFSIGDGGAAVFTAKEDEQANLKCLTLADSGEYAGQTRFLSRKELADTTKLAHRIVFQFCEDFTFLALMTDGITDPKFETDAKFEDPHAWTDFWSELTTEVDFDSDKETRQRQFMSWMDFWSPGNHDDRTLLLLLQQGTPA
jgi:serine/threonine protein phosphatase PrpC